ncbi:MAG TPA: tetratricopeptide repeat protein, partial [Planctomycetota bacterium]|nr:tetratricopeptide repeat protein [Planctomycetota bacterium]
MKILCAFLLCSLALQDIDELVARGLEKASAKDFEGAIAEYTKAIAVDPKNATAYSYRGNAKASMKDFDGAMEDYSKAIELVPGYTGAYNNRAHLKSLKGDQDGAIEDLT